MLIGGVYAPGSLRTTCGSCAYTVYMANTQESIRLSVNMNLETAASLKDIAEHYGITVTEAVRRVVSLAHFVEEKTRKGGVVLIQDKNGKQQELVML